jgi:hypothetical protein
MIVADDSCYCTAILRIGKLLLPGSRKDAKAAKEATLDFGLFIQATT